MHVSEKDGILLLTCFYKTYICKNFLYLGLEKMKRD